MKRRSASPPELTELTHAELSELTDAELSERSRRIGEVLNSERHQQRMRSADAASFHRRLLSGLKLQRSVLSRHMAGLDGVAGYKVPEQEAARVLDLLDGVIEELREVPIERDLNLVDLEPGLAESLRQIVPGRTRR